MPWVKTKKVYANILQNTWRELGVAYVKFLQTADYEILWNQLAFSETGNLNNFKTNQTIHVTLFHMKSTCFRVAVLL